MKTANFVAFSAKIETGFLFQNVQLAKRPTSSTANFEVCLYTQTGISKRVAKMAMKYKKYGLRENVSKHRYNKRSLRNARCNFQKNMFLI